MSDKIEPLGQWGAKAALHSALEGLADSDQVLILGVKKLEDGDYQRVMRSANMTQAEALYEMERRKIDMFISLDD